MDKKIENIEEVVKQAFDGFEANVDPSVWSNIQGSIASGSAATSVATSTVGKAVILKMVAGFIAIGTIATATYFVLDDSETTTKEIVTENVVQENVVWDEVSDKNKTIKTSVKKSEEKKVLDAVEIEEEKNEVMDLGIASKNIESTDVEITSSEEVEDQSFDKNNDIEESKEVAVEVKELSKEKAVKAIEKNKATPTPAKTRQETGVLSGKIIASVTSGKAPLDVEFYVEGDNIVSYAWDFDDGSELSNGSSPIHTFNSAGIYKVTLTVIDKHANFKTVVQSILVKKALTSSIGAIQQVFTPNNDGINDVFIIKSAENIEFFNAIIKTMSGNVVYEWNNIEEGWDGRDQSGRMMDSGAYLLIINAKGFDGEDIQKAKVITLKKEIY